MIRDYKLHILAHNSTGVTVKGEFVAFIESSHPNEAITVSAISKNGDRVAELGFRLGDKLPELPIYSRLEVHNPSDYAVDITIIAGMGRFDSDRLAGQVSITGGVEINNKIVINSYDKNANESYSKAFSMGGTSGKYTGWSIRNPIGSGVVIKVQMKVVNHVTATVQAYKISGAFNDIGTETTESLKPLSIATSKGLVFASNNNSSLLSGSLGGYIGYEYVAYYHPDIPKNLIKSADRDVFLGEGEQFLVEPSSPNCGLSGTVFWEEIPNVV